MDRKQQNLFNEPTTPPLCKCMSEAAYQEFRKQTNNLKSPQKLTDDPLPTNYSDFTERFSIHDSKQPNLSNHSSVKSGTKVNSSQYQAKADPLFTFNQSGFLYIN